MNCIFRVLWKYNRHWATYICSVKSFQNNYHLYAKDGLPHVCCLLKRSKKSVYWWTWREVLFCSTWVKTLLQNISVIVKLLSSLPTVLSRMGICIYSLAGYFSSCVSIICVSAEPNCTGSAGPGHLWPPLRWVTHLSLVEHTPALSHSLPMENILQLSSRTKILCWKQQDRTITSLPICQALHYMFN